MLKKINKFPLIELLSWCTINFYVAVFSTIISILFWTFIPYEESTFNSLIIFIVQCILVNTIPFVWYFILYYLSKNNLFIRFWLNLNKNNLMKIKISILLFIISPISLFFITIIILDLLSFKFKNIFFALSMLIANFPISLSFPLMLFFIFEPIITKMVNKHFEKHPNSKSWLKKNYDLRMEIQNEYK